VKGAEVDWVVRVDSIEYRADGVAVLRDWLAEGRIKPDDEVFHPLQQAWMSADSVPELSAPSGLSSVSGRSPLIIRGRQGKTLTVSGDSVKIEKRGAVGHREKTIAIRNITSVEVKKPGGWVGFIQFSVAGGYARDSSYTMTGGALDAVKDENSVVFAHMPEYEVALKMKAYIESWAPLVAASAPVPSAAPVAPGPSAANQIRQLKGLLDDGILTQDEFDQKKRQLLGL